MSIDDKKIREIELTSEVPKWEGLPELPHEWIPEPDPDNPRSLKNIAKRYLDCYPELNKWQEGTKTGRFESVNYEDIERDIYAHVAKELFPDKDDWGRDGDISMPNGPHGDEDPKGFYHVKPDQISEESIKSINNHLYDMFNNHTHCMPAVHINPSVSIDFIECNISLDDLEDHKCDCGTEITYGKVPLESHSHWCRLRTKKNPGV